MIEEKRMKDHFRIKIFILVSFLSISLLYIVNEYVSSRDYVPYDEAKYISQFLMPPEGKEVVQEVDGSYRFVNINKESNISILVPNVTITVLRGKDTGTILKVSYPAKTKKYVGRNVFVDIKNINKSTNNIFFIESRCSTNKIGVHFRGNKRFILNPRQCCAIESTALMNLDRNIYIFHSCSLADDFYQHSPKFVEKLFKYPNVYVVRFNMSELLVNSPIEDLDKKRLLEKSNYPVEHTSDLIRLTLLWKFGGTYSDLDVVTLRSFNNLKTNWAGMQDEETIANGVINFEPDGTGHRMLGRALESANQHYDPTNWSTNGPLLITPIILQECRVKTVPEAQKHCNGDFTVFNSSILYPIFYPSAQNFFDKKEGIKIVTDVKSRSYSVHIWNRMSHELVVRVGSTQAYGLLADEFCPQVYRNCGTNF